jgi:hypothetical protein
MAPLSAYFGHWLRELCGMKAIGAANQAAFRCKQYRAASKAYFVKSTRVLLRLNARLRATRECSHRRLRTQRSRRVMQEEHPH